MGTNNCLVLQNYPNIFYVQHKETHTGLEQHEDVNDIIFIFGLTIPFVSNILSFQIVNPQNINEFYDF